MIETARLWHIPQLLRVLWAHTRTGETYGSARTRLTDLRLMLLCNHRGWIKLIRGDRGTVGFLVRDAERLHALYVHPCAQGEGVGRQLIEGAKAQSPRLELWVLQNNGNAIGFYAAQGFAEICRTDGGGNDEKLPDLCMVWQGNAGTSI